MYRLFSVEQKKAWMRILQGFSVVINGRAGSGKSVLIREIAKKFGANVAVTAVTGMAARNIGGTTISSYLHLGMYKHSDELIRRLNREYIDIDILVIDEYFTLNTEQLRQVDVALRSAKHRKHVPFGGVQIVLVGDNGQLLPYEGEAILPTSKIVADFVWMQFEKVFRQENADDLRLLSTIRQYGVSQSVVKALRQRSSSTEINGVVLAAHFQEMESINDEFLSEFSDEDDYLEDTASVEGDILAEPPYETIRFYEGMQVMHTHNVKRADANDREKVVQVVNGDIGIIEKIDSNNDLVLVSFPSVGSFWIGRRTFVDHETYFVSETRGCEREYTVRLPIEREIGRATYFPLRACYALTVRKAQGLGLPGGNVTEGVIKSNDRRLVYTALSRFIDLSKLYIMRVQPKRLIFAAA